MEPSGRNLRGHITSVITAQLDNFLHKHGDIAKALQEKILSNEKERKEISGIQKAARESARKAKVHNKKLRDCRIHLDTKDKQRETSTSLLQKAIAPVAPSPAHGLKHSSGVQPARKAAELFRSQPQNRL